jgi:hypothetical protein
MKEILTMGWPELVADLLDLRVAQLGGGPPSVMVR